MVKDGSSDLRRFPEQFALTIPTLPFPTPLAGMVYYWVLLRSNREDYLQPLCTIAEVPFKAFWELLALISCLRFQIQIRETRLSPRRAPRRSLLPLSPKRTQVRLKSLL